MAFTFTDKSWLSVQSPTFVPTFYNGQYKVNYLAVLVLTFPLIGVVIAIVWKVPLLPNTFVVACLFLLFNGMIGVTVGYHRLFSHRSFEASVGLQWLCAFAGTGAFQGSAKWWGRDHRIHHRYVDTDQDPYNAKRGFFFAHCGWLLMKRNEALLGRVDISDFHKNRVVMLQHRYFFPMAIVSGIILPTLICGLGWHDWLGGFCYAAFVKIFIVHHCTFFINSLAHAKWFATAQTYSDDNTSQDSWVCAILSLGEGYHNFHHAFSQDYRNGIKWYEVDPTKWVIRLCAALGFARNLYRTPNSVIELTRNKLITKQTKACLQEGERVIYNYTQNTNAKMWKWDEIQEAVASGRKLIVIDNKVIDVKKPIVTGSGYTYKSSTINWYKTHPGGQQILDNYVGKDATNAFSGGVYGHSTGAYSYLEHLCVGYLDKK